MIIIPEYLAIHEPKDELLDIINEKTFDDKVLHQKQSDFHDIKVVENEIGRFLHYKDTYQAGFIDTASYKGNLPYINYFTIPYLINPDIKNILLIGLGTGKIVNDWEKLFKNIESIDIVDIEENILDIAKEFFGFKQSEHTTFTLQDGLVFLRDCKKKYDLIVVDVASDDGIDERFFSQDYLDLIKKSLTPNGLFVSNLCSSADLEHEENTFFRSIKELYEANFKQVSIFKGDESDRVYYKAFFDIDERVIDITNVILISSLEHFIKDFSIGNNYAQPLISDYEKIGLDIKNYISGLYL